jgi:hypothetical protein
MTRDSIAAWEHLSTTAMLATLRGVVAESPGQVTMRGCSGGAFQGSVRYFVDGAPFELGPGQSIDNFFPPDQLEAVEVYTGQNVPADFFGRSCGVVVLWQRRS